MDDTRTQQALDELADLFLSGQAPTGTGSDDPRDQLNGPAPIRFGPKVRPTPPPRDLPDDAQDVVSDAPLRLHTDEDDGDDGSPLAHIGDSVDHEERVALGDVLETDDHDPMPETVGHAVAVEAVILGNLPGLSGPWLTQYAQLLAQQEGPVAILHVDDDLIDLELVEPTDHPAEGDGYRGISLRIAPNGGNIDPVTVLEALLDSGATAPGTVLVHLDPQNDEQGLSRALMIDDWTLMCGADDLAVVGGYKMLKQMVEEHPGVAQKRVGLMIMGSDPKVSQDAAAKFQSAARSFLNTPVQLLGWQKQMVPVNLRHLGRFEDVHNAWPRLAQWFDRYAMTDPQEVEEPAEARQPVNTVAWEAPVGQAVEEEVAEEPVEDTPAVEAEPVAQRSSPRFTARPRVVEAEPEPQPAPRPERVAPAARQPQPPAEPKPAPRPAAVAPPPVREPEPETYVDADTEFELNIEEPDLSDLLMSGAGAIPGGIAMEARCPQQPNTQLLLDQSGRLHLLHRHDSQEDGLEGLQPALVDLMQASKWVNEHLQLLQLTQRQLKLDADAEPVLHLFTDRADWATALAMRLGDALKLHLLQAVQVGDEQAWFCTPLN